jgi:hypothetical protein
LEDKQGEGREDIKKRKTKFDSEVPSCLIPQCSEEDWRASIKIYISKAELCQSFSSNCFRLDK